MEHKIVSTVIQGFSDVPVYFRDGTSDSFIMRENIFKFNNEYGFHPEDNPEVIYDIGANIGLVTLLLNKLYPRAKIFAFEPQKDNFELLMKNTRHLPNVQCFEYGLSNVTGYVHLHRSKDDTNFGGYSTTLNPGVSLDGIQSVFVRTIDEVVAEFGAPDFIKIDCEGTEYKILAFMTDIHKVKMIYGELHHGVLDFELLSYLQRQGFTMAFVKQLNTPCYPFHARRFK